MSEVADETYGASDAKAYDKDRLIAESHAFLGVPQHVAAGALSKASPGSKITVDDAKRAVNEWLSKEV